MNEKIYKTREEFEKDFFPKTIEKLKIKNMTPEEYGAYTAQKTIDEVKNKLINIVGD